MEKEIFNKEFDINNMPGKNKEIKAIDEQNMARNYYSTRKEAESVRRKYDRIYLEKGQGYYIVRPQKKLTKILTKRIRW